MKFVKMVDKKLLKKGLGFKTLIPRSVSFCFSKLSLSTLFVCGINSLLLLLKIMSAVAVTPGAVARIRESKEVLKDELNVQVCFIFFITSWL